MNRVKEGQRRLRSILARLGLMLLGLILTLGLLEGAARLVFSRSDRILQNWQATGESLHVADPHVIYRMRPNYHTVYTQSEYTAELSTNSHGLRDDEHAYEKPEGVYRILLLGDSFMTAIQVDFEDIFQTRLERQLNDDPRTAGSGYRFEVINTGVQGYSALNIYLTLREEGIKYQPDLVIYAFVNNDMADVIGSDRPVEGFLVYAAADSDGHLRLSQDEQPLLIKEPYDPTVAPPPPTLGGRLHRWLLDHSKLYSVLNPAFQRFGPLWRAFRNRFREPDGSVFYEDAYAVNPLPNDQARRWVAFKDLVLLMRGEATRQGACFVGLVIPGDEQVYPERVQHYYVGFDWLDAHWQADKMDRWLSDFYRENEIPYLLLSESLGPAAQGQELLYFRSDRHWTAEGHRLAAQATYEWLVNAHLVPTADRPQLPDCGS